MKRILLLTALIFSITLIFQVKSYTMAKVENSADISITTSDNALIAVPENLHLEVEEYITENVTIELTDLGEKETAHDIVVNYVAGENNLKITNNTNHEIEIEDIKIGDMVDDITLKYIEETIFPESFNNIIFELEKDIQTIPDSLDIEMYFVWPSGSAVINSKINVSINGNEPQINVNSIDLRTPVQNILPIEEETITSEEL